MKQLLLFVDLFIYHLAGAQQVNQCGIIIPPRSLASNFQSVYEARDYVNTMLESINWQENFSIQEQNGINNAYATIIRNKRYIIYDNIFLENLDGYAGTKWASISVLAHEMGHHYRNHVVDRGGSTPPKEIEADYFSGYVMAKLGATANEAVAGMEKIASARASSSHPAKADRLKSILQGWNYAKGISNNTSGNPTPTPAPQPQQNPPPSAPDASWIYLSLYGNSEMNVYLSDDGKKYTEAPLNTTQPFVFKFDVYNYGWLRFSNDSRSKTYRLTHGKDYAIIWSRRTNSWTVVEVP
ncbi:MAG: M48 family metalloprotease [Bacteroidota bacterium]|nr:M48 family metalloprotease [Bacteroidota bacterium]